MTKLSKKITATVGIDRGRTGDLRRSGLCLFH